MKTNKQNQLTFKKLSVTELSSSQIQTVVGGISHTTEPGIIETLPTRPTSHTTSFIK